jgi:putative secretion ATPase (PEP-CTERM system associated)
MYERFYQLRNRPFALSPDPDFLYPSRVHREALDYLRFGIDASAGFVVITGEIGSGKTTLLQVLLRTLDGQTTVIRLVNTLLTGPELIESMLLDLGVETPPLSKPAMLRELARLLIEQRAAGRRVVAVIDEAQNLSLDALEELRMLSNLETEKSKLIQIVLVGQPDLRDSLDRPSLEQLRQRVTVRYHLDPLAADETALYINHRLKRAAMGAPLEFPRDVADLVHARSGGVPRMINVICDAVLLLGYAEDSRVIHAALAQEAIAELESSQVLRRSVTTFVRPQPGQAAPSFIRTVEPAAAAAPVRPAPVPAPAPLSAPAPAVRDLPLRRPTVAPATAERPTRATPDFGWMRDTRRDVPRVQVARASVTTRPADSLPARATQVRPAASAASSTRPTAGWEWLKEVFFGPGPEAGR